MESGTEPDKKDKTEGEEGESKGQFVHAATSPSTGSRRPTALVLGEERQKVSSPSHSPTNGLKKEEKIFLQDSKTPSDANKPKTHYKLVLCLALFKSYG